MGERAARLKDVSATLLQTTQEERACLPVHAGSGGKRDYALQPGKESLCKIMDGLSGMTDLRELEGGVTLWQLNWVEVSWPVDDNILTKDGSRLWFKTTLRDISGSTKEAWMSEGPALALAQLSTKEEFLAAHSLRKSLFPSMASVKVVRKALKSGDRSDDTQLAAASQVSEIGAGDARRIHMTVVHAGDQQFDEAPTRATLELIPFLDALKDDTSSILPAALDMVKTSQHYAFQVFYPGEEDAAKTGVPCQKILSLIRSTRNSKSEALANGYKLTTPGIEDLLARPAADEASIKRYDISAICTMDNLPSYRLDPPRGGAQHALVTLSAMMDDVFVVDQVQLLSAPEAEQAKASLQTLLRLARQIHLPTRKRGASWSDDFSPAVAKTCRTLGRSPTEAPIADA